MCCFCGKLGCAKLKFQSFKWRKLSKFWAYISLTFLAKRKDREHGFTCFLKDSV